MVRCYSIADRRIVEKEKSENDPSVNGQFPSPGKVGLSSPLVLIVFAMNIKGVCDVIHSL